MPILGYCNIDDVVERFGEREISELTVVNSTDHTINEPRLLDAISGAEAEINLWLSRCYITPVLIPVPIIVNEWAVLISRYKLYTQIKLRDAVGSTDHQSRRDYTDCLAALKEACKMELRYPDGTLLERPNSLDDQSPMFAVAHRDKSCCGIHGTDADYRTRIYPRI